MAEISEQVKVLDGVVRYRFGDNAELMRAWASVHGVVGPFRTHTEPQVGGGETPGSDQAGGARSEEGKARWLEGHARLLLFSIEALSFGMSSVARSHRSGGRRWA